MKQFLLLIVFCTHFGAFAQMSKPVAADSITTTASVLNKPKTWHKIGSFVKEKYTAGKNHFLQNSVSELKLISHSAIVITSVSAAGTATFAFGDEPLRNFTLANRSDFTSKVSGYIEPLGRSSRMIVAAGGFYATGLALRNPKLQRAGILTASSLLINDFVTGKLKDEFQRQRPNENPENDYFEGGEGGRKHQSFPSSHTSTAFTFATSIATVYKDHKWIPPVAYGMATLVGLSRIHDNQHWATDVMAGAGVGFLTAKTTNFILKQTEKQLEKRKVNIYLVPQVSTETAGLHLGLTF